MIAPPALRRVPFVSRVAVNRSRGEYGAIAWRYVFSANRDKKESRRADLRTAYPCSSYEWTGNGCRLLSLKLANPRCPTSKASNVRRVAPGDPPLRVPRPALRRLTQGRRRTCPGVGRCALPRPDRAR